MAEGELARAAPPGAIDALLAPRSVDAGAAAAEPPHAMAVMLCAPGSRLCLASPGGDLHEARYRVVFGSGRAEVRSRGQAMADLYQELRDRTAAGEHLAAEPRAVGDGGAPSTRDTRRPVTSADTDPLSQCAFHLLDLVDGAGEVHLDVVHTDAAHACKVSLGKGSSAPCLVPDAEGPPTSDRK